MKRICVFCGSSIGANQAYMKAAKDLGTLLAVRNIGLVYGGSGFGLMGAVSRAAIDAGGEVTGVIPRSMVEKGVDTYGLTDVKIVGDMHERKAQMASLVDGFIALPGGYGTMEEIFEVITWAQLGYHSKPCGFLNIAGYYDHLITFLQHMKQQAFIDLAHYDMVLVDDDASSLLDRFVRYQPPQVDKIAEAIKKNDEFNHQNGIHNG